MPWNSVILKPGVNIESTPTLGQAELNQSQLIRFRSGLAEKIGGWLSYYPFAVGGVPRAMHAWQDLNDGDHLAVGSTTTLGVITDGDLSVITPQTLTSNVAPDFTTAITSTTVTVVDTNINTVTTFDSVEFKTPVSVGGIILSGVYPIDLVLSATSYQITSAVEATATDTNAGAVPIFDTTSGSANIDVTLPDHGLAAGGTVVFPIATTVGGVTVSGTYTVVSVSSVDVFVISVDVQASSTTTVSMNSGDVQFLYYIALGPSAGATGYSIGTYSSGGYSTGSASSAQVGTPITATDWTHDNWGATLLSCPENGGIYEWTPNTGFQTAKLVSGAPPFNKGIFVAAPAQILLAFGSSQTQGIGQERDPLVYNWSDQLDYSFWSPGVVNPNTGNFSQAGQARIPTGSKIVAGMQAPQQALLWTDLDLWAINYIGAPEQGLTFGQTKIASSCGAVGLHAVGQLGNVVYWMGQSNFFSLSGQGVTPIKCSVWDAIFQNIDTAHIANVRAAPNTPFNEMWWFYPSAASNGENDSYVKVNVLDGSWDYGTLVRSAWIDQSVLGKPIGATPAGIIYQHESGYNDGTQPIAWSFTTSYWMIADGEDVQFVDFLIPDFTYGTFSGAKNAQIEITLYSVMYPGDTPREYGPYTVKNTSSYVNPRLRGRQMAIKFSGSDLDTWNRLGRVRYRVAADGRI